jgi:hypothetical protein
VQIRVPKGAKGGYMQHVTHYSDEVELLLQRGTQLRFTGQFKDMVLPTGDRPNVATRKVAIFELAGQAALDPLPSAMLGEAHEGEMAEREEPKEKTRPDRFAWSDDDLVKITDDDVVPVEPPEDEAE